MAHAKEPESDRFIGLIARVVVILAVGVSMTAFAHATVAHQQRDLERQRFATTAATATTIAKNEVQSILTLGRNTASIVGADWPTDTSRVDDLLDRDTAFMENPGLGSIWVVESVAPDGVLSLIEREWAAGRTDFTVDEAPSDSGTLAVVTHTLSRSDLAIDPIGLDLSASIPTGAGAIGPDANEVALIPLDADAFGLLSSSGLDGDDVAREAEVDGVDLLMVHTVTDLNSEPVGWVLTTYRVSATLARAWQSSGQDDLGISLRRLTGDDDGPVEIATVSGHGASPMDRSALHHASTFEAGGFDWRADVWGTYPPGTSQAEGVAIVGLALTAMLAALAVARHRFRRRVGEYADRLSESERRNETDHLTGISNREGLTRRLEAMRGGPGSIALAFVDIDRFKMLNDAAGHEVGDRLLADIAERLVAGAAPASVSRFGGDEFVVVCDTATDEAGALALGERIRDAVSGAVAAEPFDFVATASVGVTVTRRATLEPADVLRDADRAMYQAKDKGGDNVVFLHGTRGTDVAPQSDIERELRLALQRDEFRPRFQPLVDRDGVMRSAEALIRWEHPVRGTLEPSDFLPEATALGMLSVLTERVLAHAVRAVAEWPDMSVSVNVTEQLICDPSFPRRLSDLLDQNGVEGRRLILELGESLLLDRFDSKRDTLRALRALGVALAIDEVTYGRSSLRMIHQLDLAQAVKLDRSLVVGVADDPVDQAITTTVCHLAGSLGLSIVGEGVETHAQLEALEALGVTLFQGYLFAPAIPPQMITALVGRPLLSSPREGEASNAPSRPGGSSTP